MLQNLLREVLRHCLGGCFVIAICLTYSDAAVAQKSPSVPVPDFTKGDDVPAGFDHDWNLGPTGARGWIHTDQFESTKARQILITKVDPKSPADGKLKVGDVITGVNKSKFSFDPRVEFGVAIGEAEATHGKLALDVWRDGKKKQTFLKLKVLGRYSDTAPFDCPKSKKIFEMGCDALAQRMSSSRPGRSNLLTYCLNNLALLSSGDKKHLPIIKRQMKKISQYSDTEGRGLCSWYYGPANMMVAEYTMATGDRTYLSQLKRMSLEIVDGQSAVGSWGHRFARDDGRLQGYGMMNAPGIPLTTSLVMARKAGVKSKKLDDAIEKSTQLLRFYAGKGSIPYGDHPPWMESHEDNGKNGAAAILFNLLGERETATYFSHMSVASYGNERERGHTGNYFNLFWAMPAVSLSGPNASGAWMKEYSWYFDLARKWDGSFEHQGPAQAKKDKFKGWDASGAFLLAYGQPLRKIYLTGKEQKTVGSLSEREAKQLIEDGRGYVAARKNQLYVKKSTPELFKGLSSWSPIVRHRAAQALAKRNGDFNARLILMLKSKNIDSRLGACEALAMRRGKSSAAIPALRKTLKSDDMWLRIKAAQALASMGRNARVAIPDLFALFSDVDLKSDPRGMQQRYLSVLLFDQRGGMLARSLDGIDREQLYKVVREGLQNQDGKARGSLATVYRNLSFNELKPILPAIHRAVVEPAPTGNMFADTIRLRGLELLAKHRIKEGMEVCLDVMETDRWGQGPRVKKCLAVLATYGGAAKQHLPALKSMQQTLNRKPRKSNGDRQQIELLNQTISKIQNDRSPKPLKEIFAKG